MKILAKLHAERNKLKNNFFSKKNRFYLCGKMNSIFLMMSGIEDVYITSGMPIDDSPVEEICKATHVAKMLQLLRSAQIFQEPLGALVVANIAKQLFSLCYDEDPHPTLEHFQILLAVVKEKDFDNKDDLLETMQQHKCFQRYFAKV